MRWWMFGALLLLSSCGGSTGGSREGGGSGGTKGGGEIDAGDGTPPPGSGADETGTGGAPPPGSGGIGPFFDAGFGPCEGVALSLPHGTDLQVNAYVLIDASAAMGEASPSGNTWWEEMATAVAGYATDRRLRTATNAFQFYPQASDAGACGGSYDVPALPAAMLSTSIGTLGAAFEDRVPEGENLPGQAVSTALHQLQTYLSGTPFDRAALVLVVRTTPGQCPGTDLASVVHAAGTSYPPIQTHVLVLGDGSDPSVVDEIAKAGFTDSARFLPGKDLRREFSDEMLRVRYPVLGCTYDLPEYYVARRGVTVNATAEGAATVPLSFVDTLEECEANRGGVVYDGETVPPKITLCPQTCTRYAGASMSATLGCSRGRHE